MTVVTSGSTAFLNITRRTKNGPELAQPLMELVVVASLSHLSARIASIVHKIKIFTIFVWLRQELK